MRRNVKKCQSGILSLFIMVCLLGLAQIAAAQSTAGSEEIIPIEEAEGGMTTLANADEALQAELRVSIDKTDVERFIITQDPTICPECCTTCCTPLPGGIDHVAAGTGTRNAGYGTIHLQGAPDGAVVVRATLYWANLEVAPAPTQTIFFQGQAVTGNLIGTTIQTCWNGATVFAAYSASVVPLIYPAIDGDYQVAGLPSFITSGRNPWANPNRPTHDLSPPMTQGASLVVEYSHPAVPIGARVYTHTGPWFFGGNTLTLTHALTPPLPLGGFLRHTRLGGDGQVGSGVTPIGGVPADSTFINGVQIKGPGAVNQDSDWNGGDGAPLNQLWDTNTSDVTGTIAVGAPTYTVTYTAPNDCVGVVAHVLTSR